MARVGSPRGVSGYLKLHSYSGEYAHLAALTEVILESPASGRKRARIVGTESGAWGMSALFEGFPSPETARSLTGMDILVPPDRASPLKENEWYVSDLVGLRLVLEGRAVATVEGVLDGAADPLLECRLPGASGGPVLVPFRKEFVGEVDVKAGTIELLHGWLLE